MARSGGDSATFADLLGRRRDAGFVGRSAEQALFADVLSGESAARVLWIHGPGGVGKSTLTRAFRRTAVRGGMTDLLVDFASVEARPDVVLRELSSQGWVAGAQLSPVLTVDSFERAPALESWLRDDLFPDLPDTAVVVVASRRPPGDRWRADEGWRALLREVRLRNFAPEETAAYLTFCGVPASEHGATADLTHGHPLALSLVADLTRHGADTSPARLGDAPALVDELVRRLVDTVPDDTHRRALQVCAHAWMTTEDLLREVLEVPDASELLAWLRSLSMVEVGPYGAFPHDLARDAIDADFRWRDAVAYADLHHRVHRSSVRRARRLTGAEQQRAIMEVVHAHRHSATAAFWDYDELGTAYFDGLHPADADHLLRMTRLHQGAEQAELVGHWLSRQPESFRVVRSGGAEPAGFAALVRLDLADGADLDRDPTMRAARRALDDRRPLRPGDHATVMRFFLDAERNQAPSRTLNLGPVLSIQTLLEDAAIAWDVLCWIDSGAMDPLMDFIDYRRLDGAEHRVGTNAYALFGRDFRRAPLSDWFDLLADRELGAPVAAAHNEVDFLALSFEEFATSAGRALKDLTRPDRLAANPLCRSRLVLEGDEDQPPGERLAARVREAVAALAEHPRDERLARAVDRTYVRPAPTQEAAAEVLGLPFSTYRRHLTRGVERTVELLWHREIGIQEVSNKRSGR